MRSILVGVALASIALASVRHRIDSQRKALECISAHHGKVLYSTEVSPGFNFVGKQPPLAETDSWRTTLFRSPVYVRVCSPSFTDEQSSILRNLTQLEKLELQGTSITDKAMNYLCRHEKLRIVKLSGTRVTGEGIGLLASCPIEEIHLNDMGLTDADMLGVVKLPHLKFLALNGNPIGDASIDRLTHLEHLERLSLCNTRITRRGLNRLRNIPQLRELNGQRSGCLLDLDNSALKTDD